MSGRMGIKFEVRRDKEGRIRSALPDVRIMDGIEACRNIFARTWIDSHKCKYRPCGWSLVHAYCGIVVHIMHLFRTMRFESHFKSYFGNVKAFNLKKIKIIAEPVAAMAGGGP